MKIKITIIFFFIFFISCTSPKQYISPTPVKITPTGFTEATKGEVVNAHRVIDFSISDEATFTIGEVVTINFDGIDFENYFIDFVQNDDNNKITLKLVNKKNGVILFQEKCQNFQRFDLEIPKIEVADGLSPQQVVMTPLFDDHCQQIGWDVRYGSIESGCKSKSITDIVKIFTDCSKGGKTGGGKDKGHKSQTGCTPIQKKLGICK